MLIAGNETEGIGLGTAQFAFRDRTAEDSVATVHAALDAGVMLIDTALAYTRPGVESYAEQVVAHALRGLTTGRPLVATKGGHWRRGDSFPVDERPDTLRVHCEISLRTLETDRIDLYQLHHVDSQVPLPDSVGALGQLRQEGRSRPRVEESRDDLPVPGHQQCGLLPLPGPRCHRILPVLRRHPAVKREPQSTAGRLPGPPGSAPRPRRQHIGVGVWTRSALRAACRHRTWHLPQPRDGTSRDHFPQLPPEH
jgi:hypothetical protein